jgi:hypothetical protein
MVEEPLHFLKLLLSFVCLTQVVSSDFGGKTSILKSHKDGNFHKQSRSVYTDSSFIVAQSIVVSWHWVSSSVGLTRDRCGVQSTHKGNTLYIYFFTAYLTKVSVSQEDITWNNCMTVNNLLINSVWWKCCMCICITVLFKRLISCLVIRLYVVGGTCRKYKHGALVEW